MLLLRLAAPPSLRILGVATAAPVRCRGRSKKSGPMPRGVKKENLPSKTCVSCGRPFTWRKKWERCWDEVTTCSNRCNSERKAAQRGQGGTAPGESTSPP